ncbi:MAG TPA: hypothetical protein VE219_03410 [Candidatus Sulfotelmatobacter sp.]|nr:hypothetical protein [Candidatus Sulfotelmatobacter sp.]
MAEHADERRLSVRPVAGCLFEIVLPPAPAQGGRWEWQQASDEVSRVTLLWRGSGSNLPGNSENSVTDADRFRFRAETPGTFTMCFIHVGPSEKRRVVTLVVDIAPERTEA